ncbi:MAG TPA: alanyl-tRNA editing protein, partial [Thermomicrobiales bacterium]|nr:alanyl-tRNA editing protein [Thermomicrobiales bacterium]
MTELLFLDDSYARQCVARVVDHAPYGGILLDRTILYPTGGGQPHDLGSLTQGNTVWTISSVKKAGPNVVHHVDSTGSLPEIGSEVIAEVDWERRYRLMRTHTAMHILCGVIFHEFGALVTG